MLSEAFVILSGMGVGIYGPMSLPGPWSHVLSGEGWGIWGGMVSGG